MTDFESAWRLTRDRFIAAIDGLSDEQLRWRLHDEALTIGEMALHVAGVEVSFSCQLKGVDSTDFEAKVRSASTDGILNERPFPFKSAEINGELIKKALELGKSHAEPLIQNPDSVRSVEIVSALGPVIDGTGAFARLAYHAGYHQGQVHLVKSAPGFPTT